ncbi:VanZ family protein [Sulfitobacter sp. 1A13679]|uniref:VanZ family protein n=1 Tax=Sulfitobacter sp. 1A13679 TaxID=3368597 RepID=UPI0037450040
MSIFQEASLGPNQHRSIAIWLTIGMSVCITLLTLIPLNTPTVLPGSDKTHHVLVFMSLILPSAAFYPDALPRVALAATFYAGLIEVIQPFVGRSGEMADFLADLLGISVGAMIGLLLHRGGGCWSVKCRQRN